MNVERMPPASMVLAVILVPVTLVGKVTVRRVQISMNAKVITAATTERTVRIPKAVTSARVRKDSH